MKLLTIARDDVKMRLDRWLKGRFHRPQSFFQRHLREKRIVLVDATSLIKTKVDAGYKLSDDSNLRVGIQKQLYDQLIADTVAVVAAAPASTLHTSLPVLFEDDSLLAVLKPPHLATQLGSKTHDAVATRYPQYKLVHRLDKGTSGVLLLAKTRRAAAEMAELFRTEQVHKTYVAKVTWPPHGMASNGVVHKSLDAKPATTHFAILERAGRFAWLELKPTTGRKHQLRRHCAEALFAPIVGDRRYGGAPAPRMWLHAKRVEFLHPLTKVPIVVEAPLRETPVRAGP
ncbi:pseudouridine synthase [Achlya hypogyna]|uniref:Pseudouridine synthase n=1 Tax=Achlya hypogyna TaxID=1202772 RepID=A0A1V9ZI06_ACHHY|nr:pseudouridine synthase [Achlya hypogyna]